MAADRVVYRSEVVHLPATPLGLLPPRWTIRHTCGHCHRQVETDHLVTHAKAHYNNDQSPPCSSDGRQTPVAHTIPAASGHGDAHTTDNCIDSHTP